MYIHILGQSEYGTTSSALKIVTLTGLLTSLILYSAYCASLVSQFSIPVVPIGRFEDLLTHSFTFYTDFFSVAGRTLIRQVILKISIKHLKILPLLSLLPGVRVSKRTKKRRRAWEARGLDWRQRWSNTWNPGSLHRTWILLLSEPPSNELLPKVSLWRALGGLGIQG